MGRGARAWQAQIGGLTAGSCMRGWTGACVAVGGTAEELRLLVGCASAERAVACVGVWLESARGADVLGRRVPRVFGHVLILDTAVRDDLDLDLTFQSLHENTWQVDTDIIVVCDVRDLAVPYPVEPGGCTLQKHSIYVQDNTYTN